VGGRRGGEGGRRATVLWRGDVERRSGGMIEREAWWRASSPRCAAERGHGELSRRCGEVSFSFLERLEASG
jgi:hypothetical protein